MKASELSAGQEITQRMCGLDGGIYGSSLGRGNGRDTDESRRKQFVEGEVCGKCAMMGKSNRRCRWNLHRPCAAVQSADHLELLHQSPHQQHASNPNLQAIMSHCLVQFTTDMENTLEYFCVGDCPIQRTASRSWL